MPTDSVAAALKEVHSDIVRRFEMERGWKDTLESKGLSFLGFVGITQVVLLSVTALGREGSFATLTLVAAPMFLQTLGTILLFRVVLGYTEEIGPSPVDMLAARGRGPDWVRRGAVVAYGTSVLSNRILLTRSAAFYRLAVLLASVALVQLGISVAAGVLDPSRSLGVLWHGSWVLWAPAALGASFGIWLAVRSHSRVEKEQREELNRWVRLIQEESHGKRRATP